MKPKRVAKKKLEVVFNEEKRKEFLTGFRKRKNERRKKAQDQLDRALKAERIRIRQEVKDGMKHMKKSFEPLRELTEEDKAIPVAEDEYEDDDVKVKIVELSTNDLAAQRHMLGQNQGEDSDEETDDDKRPPENDGDEQNTNCIPGMDFDVNERRRRQQRERSKKAKEGQTATKKSKSDATENTDIKSKKELDRMMKTKTMRKLKQSKAFKQKERIDKRANQKKARRDKNNTLKSLPQHLRKKKKGESSMYSKGKKVNKKQARKPQRHS